MYKLDYKGLLKLKHICEATCCLFHKLIENILNSYCTIEISLTTHDEKKITEKDLILASKIDELFGNFIANEK